MTISSTPEPGVPLPDLEDVRLLVVEGASGTGKSTVLAHLGAGRRGGEIRGGPIDWSRARTGHRLVFVDELLRLRDLAGLIGLLLRGHTVFAASHLPSILTRTVGLLWRARFLRLGRDPAAIERYLHARNIPFSPAAVREFTSVYGASYIDARIVMEGASVRCFDTAWRRFKRHRRVRREDWRRRAPCCERDPD